MQATQPILAENRVILNPVSWETFNQLLQELGDKRSQRLAYSQGTMEIMTPLGKHEHSNRFIERLIYTIIDELELEIKSLGSLTLKVDSLKKGVEPDSCFYIQNEFRVRNKQNIEIGVDPVPDLVLEIDVTSSSLDKLSIYGALEVPEIWRYNGYTLTAFIWDGDNRVYQVSDYSQSFTWLRVSELSGFMQQCLRDGETKTLRDFRRWLQSQACNFY
ncbi:MAG: Uma2 family endonuclease [Snowella sp.]|nr:Uma2 family endonuclease [Snowella sp.]